MAIEKKVQKGFWENTFEIIGLLTLVFLIRTFGFGLYQVPSGSMEKTMLIGERFFADKLSYNFRAPRRSEIISFNQPPGTGFNYSDNKIMNMYQHYVWGPANWTKRVIGIPGDEVKGVVEDGKPVIYLNGKKLDEPYLNTYPLAAMWTENPKPLLEKADRLQEYWVQSGENPAISQKYKKRLLKQFQISPRSYDPQCSYEDQPFYHFDSGRVVLTDSQKPKLKLPGKGREASEEHKARIDQSVNSWSGTDEFYVKLGSDEYWVMGDNRRGSKDSRFFGPIKQSFIHGRIVFRIWSHDSDHSWWIVDLLCHPVSFWNHMRWGRFFQIVW